MERSSFRHRYVSHTVLLSIYSGRSLVVVSASCLQAFFYSTNAASIRVIRETQDGEKSVITACFLKTSDVDKTDWTLPCNVFNVSYTLLCCNSGVERPYGCIRQHHVVLQVVGLEADDKVYLDMQSYAFFRVRREALHFTVIKLNSQSIATEAAAGS